MTNSLKLIGAFALGLTVTAVSTFAQSYGRGRNVQFIDGATISPTSVQASGTGDQFMCTATTAVCEVESNITAATMTSTVPAFDIGPTATPGANDRLACFSYGPSGSKTRVACVDTEGDFNVSGNMVLPNTFLCMNSACTTYWRTEPTFGDINLFRNSTQIMYVSGIPALNIAVPTSATSISSTVASGSQAYTCTNVGCRLSLGNTGRYLYDTGSALASIGAFSASQFTSRYHTASATPVEVGTTVSTAETNPIQFSTSNTFTGDTVNFVSAFNGPNQIFAFSKDGLLRVNKHNAAKPTCNADNRGRIFFLDGASGAADVFEVCGKDATNAYSWKSIVTW